MFDAYFCPRVVRRLKASPDATTIESFVSYLHCRSHTRLTIQGYVRAVEVFLRNLRRRQKSPASIDEAAVRAFACGRRSQQRPRSNIHAALRHLLRHLRSEGMTIPRSSAADPHLFVRHRAPLGIGVSRELVRGAMRRAYAQVAGCESWTGTHVLPA